MRKLWHWLNTHHRAIGAGLSILAASGAFVAFLVEHLLMPETSSVARIQVGPVVKQTLQMQSISVTIPSDQSSRVPPAAASAETAKSAILTTDIAQTATKSNHAPARRTRRQTVDFCENRRRSCFEEQERCLNVDTMAAHSPISFALDDGHSIQAWEVAYRAKCKTIFLDCVSSVNTVCSRS